MSHGGRTSSSSCGLEFCTGLPPVWTQGFRKLQARTPEAFSEFRPMPSGFPRLLLASSAPGKKQICPVVIGSRESQQGNINIFVSKWKKTLQSPLGASNFGQHELRADIQAHKPSTTSPPKKGEPQSRRWLFLPADPGFSKPG